MHTKLIKSLITEIRDLREQLECAQIAAEKLKCDMQKNASQLRDANQRAEAAQYRAALAEEEAWRALKPRARKWFT